MNSTTSLDFTSLAMNWSMAIYVVLVCLSGVKNPPVPIIYIAQDRAAPNPPVEPVVHFFAGA
jgi:hypothetical protein